ncbi:uncharacterized protein PV09_00704 [Verruconis gallopava]|uniref:Uncharacterized protein n=1 Tax=Verruconis gallopava TaxID=253628 RepID=A0A0D1Y105_9PEZI|nr:uncharacterized protein PV09_00704 [Verruconis gallopava]KIW08766.1 hypothetical protein PV09_00704 [Verruconis gallopava]
MTRTEVFLRYDSACKSHLFVQSSSNPVNESIGFVSNGKGINSMGENGRDSCLDIGKSMVQTKGAPMKIGEAMAKVRMMKRRRRREEAFTRLFTSVIVDETMIEDSQTPETQYPWYPIIQATRRPVTAVSGVTSAWRRSLSSPQNAPRLACHSNLHRAGKPCVPRNILVDMDPDHGHILN